jgi:hypothetical protein
MLYLHLGWPKTGTTTLQRAMAEHRDLLDRAGTVYPDRWSREGDDSHNNIADWVGDLDRYDTALRELTDFLTAHAGKDVLLSSESLTTRLLRPRPCEALLTMVRTIREVMPVTVVCTLRRLDDLIHSLYVQFSLAGVTTQTPQQFMEGGLRSRLFANMRRLGDSSGGGTVYCKYDRGGAHNVELLHALELPADVSDAVLSNLRAMRRLNASRSHKQMSAAINVDELSARCGVELSKRALLDAFDRDGLRFDGDRPCELAGEALRRDLREAGLESARKSGFAPYLEFFEEAEAEEAPAAEPFEADDLSDEDLDRLVSHLTRGASRPPPPLLRRLPRRSRR